MLVPDSALDRRACAALDAASPFADTREQFDLPEGLCYLDGNSLGPPPRGALGALRELVGVQWRSGLVRSWSEAGWWSKPLELGERLAPLVGAGDGQVVVCDSISVNLFKVLTAAARLRPGRRVLLVEADAFPTDRYLAASVAELLGLELRCVEPPWRRWQRESGVTSAAAGAGGPAGSSAGAEAEAGAGAYGSAAATLPSLEEALDASVAAVLLGHVDYRSAYRYDLAATTALVHRSGALVVWDLAHSAGAVPVRLDEAGADFAVGCTYKYLNAGPGAPGYLYAARRHLAAARQPLCGWHGHAEPFAFLAGYEPDPGIRRFLAGSPPLVAYAALEASLSLWAEVDENELGRARDSLSELLMSRVAARCPELELASPSDPPWRGSHLSYRHRRAHALVDALAAAGVIADARQPDLLRLALTPLYLRHVDVYDAVERLAGVLAGL